jgi:hypothetical protein
MRAPKRRSSSSTTSSSSSSAAMRLFRLSYIAPGSIGTESAFFLDLPFVVGSFAGEAVLAECSWRADPDGGVGAGHVGGGLGTRGEVGEAVAVVVTVPFIAAGWQAV